MWLTRLAELADPKYGLRVVFEPGWRTRGASGGAQMKAVQGVLWHHDVAPKSGTYPLRAMLRDGRKGLSGPLCHIGFDRDGVVHVVGAGKANHAGTGKVPGVVRNGGNTRLIGVEMTSTGRGDWTAAQLREMPKLGRALNVIFGLDASQHWSHKEYSDSGKIDPYGLPGGMAGLRDRIRAAYTGGLAGPGGGMSVPLAPPAKAAPDTGGLSGGFADVDKTQAWLIGLGYDPGPADGKYGPKTQAATLAFQTDFGIKPADGRPGPATRKHLEDTMAKIDDIQKQLDRIERTLQPGIKGERHDGELARFIRTQTRGVTSKDVQDATKAAVTAALAKHPGVDTKTIEAAVTDGVQGALNSLRVTVEAE